MAKIFLIASQGIKDVNCEVKTWMQQYAAQGHELIFGDTKADANFHRVASALGIKNSCTIYAMDNASNNSFGIKERIFDTYYDEETKKARIVDRDTNNVMLEMNDVADETVIRSSDAWYKFKDKLMMDECAMAIIVVPNGQPYTKRVNGIIQRLSVYNKPRYIKGDM